MLNLDAQLKVSDLDREHPEYTLRQPTWGGLDLLYQSGDVLYQNANVFLKRRPKEPSDVYGSRCDVFNSTPILGNITGWYASAAFAKPIDFITKQSGIEDIEQAVNITPEAAEFTSTWFANCDATQTPLAQFFQLVFEGLIIYRDQYVLIDLPQTDYTKYSSLLDQRKAGALDPILRKYDPLSILNWSEDDNGNLQWCVLKTTDYITHIAAPTTYRERWYIYDADEVTAYEATSDWDNRATLIRDKARLANRLPNYPRPHALSDYGIMPITRWSLPQGLWLGNRVYLPLIKHLNMENALDWQILNCALAQLAVFGEYEDNPQISEVAWHKFPKDTEVRWLEPEGKSIAIHRDRVADLREECYRSCYLIDQARTNKSTPTAQSGISKEQDKTPSRDALEGLMGVISPKIQSVINNAMLLRDDLNIEIDVRMPSFADRDTADVLDETSVALSLNIPSDSLYKELFKHCSHKLVPNASPDMIQRFDAEIDTAPGRSELAAQALAAASGQFAQSLNQIISN